MMHKKKILVICNSLCKPSIEMSGMAAIYNFLRQLSKHRDLEIHVLTSLPSWGTPIANSRGLIFYYVKADNLLLLRTLFFLKALALNHRFKYDVIHDYSSLPVLVGITGIVAKLLKRKGIHTLCTVNTSFLGSEKLLFGQNWVESVICTDLITKRRLQRQVKNVVYIPLGLELNKFKISKQPKRPHILFLGSLEKRKGAYVLAESIKHVVAVFPEVFFTFASFGKEVRDPNYSENLAVLKKQIGVHLDKVKFFRGRQNVAKLMAGCSIFVLPTVSRHGILGQPLTLLEAMASGKACVVSSIQKGDGLVKHGINCLLFSSGNSRNLAEKIISLISNPSLGDELGRNARNNIKSKFDLKKTTTGLYKFYCRIKP